MRVQAFFLTIMAAFAVPTSAGFLDLPGDEGAILPVDEAFVLHEPVSSGNGLLLGWDIAPGHYLYRDRISVVSDESEDSLHMTPEYPPGQAHQDEHLGQTVIYRDQLRLEIPLGGGKPPRTITVEYQGCAEDKVCYPPQTRTVEVMH